ncbi:MAG: branched-chain-amino-acid transaminase [Phycisphaerae bacterium]
MSAAIPGIRATSANPYAPDPDLRIWVGDELVPAPDAKISVFDHALLYGDGVFEGIRIYGGKIFKEAEHVKRFFESAKAIRLEIPMTAQQICDAMHTTMKANGLTGDGYIRLVVTRGVGSLGISVAHTACPTVIIIADRIALYPPEVYERGLHCIVSSITRNHPNSTSPRVKSLNYLNNIMAKLEARDAGADEAIMLTFDGHVCECTGDNIFLVREGVILTPPTSEGILKGITRDLVITLARKRDIDVVEQSLIRHDLYVADECFGTGTAAEIVPITEIDHRPVGDGTPGPITKQLTEDFIKYRTPG